MSAENWHEERDRLVQLLHAITSGKVTHVDEDGLRQLQATSPENIADLKERLAKLNVRLGDEKAARPKDDSEAVSLPTRGTRRNGSSIAAFTARKRPVIDK